LFTVPPRDDKHVEKMFTSFRWLLKKIKTLQRSSLIKVTPELEDSKDDFKIGDFSPEQLCREIVSWFKKNYFYEPKYLCRHFKTFFGY
jgi:hypothetical protein